MTDPVELHPRAVIRRNAKAMLTGKTLAGPNIRTSKFNPHMPKVLPALAVYTLTTNTDAESQNDSTGILSHMVGLVVEVAVAISGAPGEAEPDDVLDAICLQVERVMGADRTIGGAVKDSWITGTADEFVEQGEARYAVAAMTFEAHYERGYPAPQDQGAIDEFLRAEITYAANGATGDDRAKDSLKVRTP